MHKEQGRKETWCCTGVCRGVFKFRGYVSFKSTVSKLWVQVEKLLTVSDLRDDVKVDGRRLHPGGN